MVRFDGREWEVMPDFGSFKPVKLLPNNIHIYKGLSKDVSKLPTYVGSGSKADCVDTSEVYEFEETTKRWYKRKNTSVNIEDISGGNNNESTDTPVIGGNNNMHVEGDSLVIEI